MGNSIVKTKIKYKDSFKRFETLEYEIKSDKNKDNVQYIVKVS